MDKDKSLIERLERLAALDTKLGNRTDDPRNRVAMMEEAAARIRVLEGEREHLLNAHVQSFALLNECREWLSQCADWLLSNDLDMTCPMQTDPQDIVERIDAHTGVVKLGRAALNEGTD